MSKIKRYEPYTMDGDPFYDKTFFKKSVTGDFLRCSDIIPGTNVTVLEGVEKVRELVVIAKAIWDDMTCDVCPMDKICLPSQSPSCMAEKALTLEDGRMIELTDEEDGK